MQQVFRGVAILLLFGWVASVGAQTANVIALEPADAKSVQKAWDELQAAQLLWEAKKSYIDRKYVPDGEPGRCTIGLQNRCVADQWYQGLEFSKDFRFIVPKPAQKFVTSTGNNLIAW